MKAIRVFAVTAAVILSGCYQTFGNSVSAKASADEIWSRVRFTRDPHMGTQAFEGPSFYAGDHVWKIRGWRPKNSEAPWSYQIYVTAVFRDWAFLDSAWSYGRRLDMVEINRDVGACSSAAYGNGCRVEETVGVSLTRAQIEACASDGLSYKLVGRGGSVNSALTAPYCEAIRRATSPREASGFSEGEPPAPH